jgi:acetate kinase
MGIQIDKDVNANSRGEECILSPKDSKVTVIVIPTDEELMIASDTLEIVSAL